MKHLFIIVLTLGSLSGFSQEKKKPVAVLELISSGKLDKSEVITLTKRFRDMLVQTDVFNVLERDKMDAILKEQDFILSDNCNSAECAVEVGQLLGVEAVVTGDIGKVGNTWTVSLRLVDMTTGKIEKTETMDYQGDIDGLLDVMRQIAFIFAGKQPPKGKTTLIVQSGVNPNPASQGRILIEAAISGPIMKENIIYDKFWKSKDDRKKVYNEAGFDFSFCYLLTPRVKVGFTGKSYGYSYKDSLMFSPTNIADKILIGKPIIYAVGPKVGYFFYTGTIKPYIDFSVCYSIFNANLENIKYPGWPQISGDEMQKRKKLKNHASMLFDVTPGFSIRLWRYTDLLIALRFMYAPNMTFSGSGNLNAGLVFHAGKGFPETKK